MKTGDINNVEQVSVLATDEFASLEDAIRHYLHMRGNPRVDTVVVGIANPVLGDHVKMTNHSWSFSSEYPALLGATAYME